MAMTEEVALRRLRRGIAKLADSKKQRDRERAYIDGDHDQPFAPPGVSREYKSLREISQANLLPLIIGAPLQRLRVDGFNSHSNRSEEQDIAFWRDTWQFNRCDARQRPVFADAMHHGRGFMSVSPRPNDLQRPRISVESPRNVHLEPDPTDPFKPLYAVKVIVDESEMDTGSGIHLVGGGTYGGQAKWRGWVYDEDTWFEFEAEAVTSPNWRSVANDYHDMGTVPFVPFDCNVDSSGTPHSPLAQLIPAQDAVNFIRFVTLLALQFSAHRHRAITGFDPVIYDPLDPSTPLLRRDAAGEPIIDPKTGLAIPIMADLGNMAVDQFSVFRNPDAKIWDLQESNLSNYIEVMKSFVSDLFARGQVPPQYQLVNMHNLTGDALTGAESTLSALVKDLQMGFGESVEQVARLSARARGERFDDMASEVQWGDGETKSFAQTVDGITKLVSTGFPRKAAFGMLPGATTQKVEGWMKERSTELQDTFNLMGAREAELLEEEAA